MTYPSKAIRACLSKSTWVAATLALSACVGDTGTLTVAPSGVGTVMSSPTGIQCGSSCSAAFPMGATVMLQAMPGPSDVFRGWGGACSGAGNCSVTIGSTQTVTAAFGAASTGVDYLLTLTESGSGTVTSNPAGIACQSSCSASFPSATSVTLAAQPAAGYTFAGWGGSCSGTSACTVSMSADQAVSATFTPTPVTDYALSVTLSGQGSVTVNPGAVACTSSCSQSFASGTAVTLTAQPASGYTFAGWGGACSGTGSCGVSMTSAQSVSASFAPVVTTNYTLTVSTSGSGTVSSTNVSGISCGSSCSASYASGTAVSLAAQAATGYTFSGWSGACSGTGACNVTMSAARSVTATFAAPAVSYVLTVTASGAGTVTSSPAGISCGSACSSSYTSGTVVTLSAQPASGSTFAGWSGACTGTSACTVTMSAAKSVSASFSTPASYALTVTQAGTGSGTVTSSPAGISCGSTCSSNYSAGTAVTLTAQPGSGSTFGGWGGACAGTGSCVVTMSAAQSVSATFSGSGGGSGACARSSSSTVNTPGAGNSNIYAWSPFGNYNVSYDDWQPDPGLTQWINSATCWGVTTTTSSENGSINSYSNVSRGWSNNQDLMNTRSTSGSNWTTLSGMGVQVSALTKAHMKWSMTVPSTPNTNDAVSRWDALIDIYLHTTANPAATAWPPQIDLQIMQTLMDQPVSGQAANTSGYFALVLSGSHAWQKTIGGVQYAGVIDAFNYNQPGGHTITMFPRPTMYTDSATTGLLWGPTSVVQDVGGIIAWLSQSNPTDDSGNPIKDANGNTITAPVIASSLYLTAINAGFEIDFGAAPSNNQWTTTDFWVAVQNEPDGQ